MLHGIRVLSAGLVLFGAGNGLGAQCGEAQPLFPMGPDADDFAGRAVAVSGSLAAVGLPGADDAAKDAGAVVVFSFDGVAWTEEARLRPESATIGEGFGSAVCFWAEGVLAVGVPGFDQLAQDEGAVQIFRRDVDGHWHPSDRLRRVAPATGDRLGSALAAEGRFLFAAAEGADVGGEDSGSVAVFRQDEGDGGWEAWQELRSSELAKGHAFGAALAADRGVLLVGAPGADGIRRKAGEATLFRRDATNELYVEEARLIDPEGRNGDEFGAAVGLAASRAVVGAPGRKRDRPGSGLVLAFRADGTDWSLAQRLRSTIDGDESRFGAALAVDDDRLAIGAPGSGADSGSAGDVVSYRWDGDEWIDPAPLATTIGQPGDAIGSSLSLQGTLLVAGAPGVDRTLRDAGGALAFRVLGPDRVELQRLTRRRPSSRSRLGEGLDLDADSLLVGEPDLGGGQLVCFEHDGVRWSQVQRLQPATRSSFGHAVALQGDVAIVTDHRQGSGRAHALERRAGQWSIVQEIAPSLPPDAGFGDALALDGDWLAIGAPFVAGNTGSCTLFRRIEGIWTEVQSLVPTDPRTGFGVSMAMSGSLLVVGESARWTRGIGRVHVYRLGGDEWALEQVLMAGASQDDARFGQWVCTDGRRIAVGALLHDLEDGRRGTVSVFEDLGGSDGWLETAVLSSESARPDTWFGSGVRIAGDRLLVGEPLAEGARVGSGVLNVFRHDGEAWRHRRRLFASTPGETASFGERIAVSQRRVAVGVPLADTPLTDSGAAYLFALEGLELRLTPDRAVAGDALRLCVFGGTPGSLFGLNVVAVNGDPLLHRVALDRLDARGHWDLELVVPPGLEGLDVSFEAWGSTEEGDLELTPRTGVRFR